MTRAGHVFDLLCNQSLLSFSLSDGFTEVLFPVVNISISKIVYIQVATQKSEFKSQAHICKFAAPWAKNNPETTLRFCKYFCQSLKLRLWKLFPSSFFTSNDCTGPCEASFHSEAVVHIYAKLICCNAKVKWCHSRTWVFVIIFDVHFSSFPFRLFACKSTFVSLEAACKTIPKIPDALVGQTSPRHAKFIVISQANGL